MTVSSLRAIMIAGEVDYLIKEGVQLRNCWGQIMHDDWKESPATNKSPSHEWCRDVGYKSYIKILKCGQYEPYTYCIWVTNVVDKCKSGNFGFFDTLESAKEVADIMAEHCPELKLY